MKKKIEGPIKMTLRQGDKYVDEPIFIEKSVYIGTEPMTTKILLHYKRIPLLWKRSNSRIKNAS